MAFSPHVSDAWIVAANREDTRVLCLRGADLHLDHEIKVDRRLLRALKLSDDSFCVSDDQEPYDITQYDLAHPEGGSSQKILPRMVFRTQKHQGNVRALAVLRDPLISDDPETLRMVSADYSAHGVIWDTASGEVIADLPGVPQYWNISCSTDAHPMRLFVGGGGSSVIREYDPVKLVILRKLHGHSSTIRGLSPDCDTSALYSVSWDRSICVWSRAGDGAKPVDNVKLGKSATSCHYANDRHLLFIGRSGAIEVRDVRKLETQVRMFEANKETCLGGIERLDSDLFVSAGKDIATWRSDGKIVKKAHESNHYYFGLAVIGSPYEFPPFALLGESADDVAERVFFALQMVQFGTRCVVGIGKRSTEILLPKALVRIQ